MIGVLLGGRRALRSHWRGRVEGPKRAAGLCGYSCVDTSFNEAMDAGHACRDDQTTVHSICTWGHARCMGALVYVGCHWIDGCRFLSEPEMIAGTESWTSGGGSFSRAYHHRENWWTFSAVPLLVIAHRSSTGYEAI